MKIFKIITLTIIALGLISTIFFVNHNGGKGVFFVILPYIFLLTIMYVIKARTTAASHIALSIAATFICIITALAYYEAAFKPGSSTDGLIFLVLPIFSLSLISIIYLLAKWLVGLVMTKRRIVRVTIGALSGLVLVWILFILIISSLNYKSTKNYRKRKLTLNIEEAKKRGVFVKELNYKIDRFNGPFDFHPYIEKAFIYGKNTSETILLMNEQYPYRLDLNNKLHEGDIFIFIKENEMGNFDSTTGSGYYGASGYLRKPELPDTIILGIRRQEIELGSIRVRN